MKTVYPEILIVADSYDDFLSIEWAFTKADRNIFLQHAFTQEYALALLNAEHKDKTLPKLVLIQIESLVAGKPVKSEKSERFSRKKQLQLSGFPASGLHSLMQIKLQLNSIRYFNMPQHLDQLIRLAIESMALIKDDVNSEFNPDQSENARRYLNN